MPNKLTRKEERIQRALGTYPSGFKLTPKGKKKTREIFKINHASSRKLIDRLVMDILMVINYETRYRTKGTFMHDYLSWGMENGKSRRMLIGKAWDKAIKEKLMKEYLLEINNVEHHD